MHELGRVATALALAAGKLLPPLAEEELSEPEREPLLADAARSMDQ
jgi:hypothetical protein